MFCSSEYILKKNRRSIFPFYHTVTDQVQPYIKHLYTPRNTDTFKKDLDTFCRYFDPVSLEEINNKKHSKRPSFHLTFDDGLRECYEMVRPLLLKKGIPATFFVNNDFIDNKALFFRYTASLILEKAPKNVLNKIILSNDPCKFILSAGHNDSENLLKIASAAGIDIDEFLTKQRPYMSSEEIRELIKNGFTVGSHSCSHPDFSEMSFSEIVSEVKRSITDLNIRFSVNCKAFSFPFTNHSISLSVFSQLKKEIPQCAYYFGTSGVKDDIEGVIQRIPMEKSYQGAAEVISGQLRRYRLKKIIGKNIVGRPD